MGFGSSRGHGICGLAYAGKVHEGTIRKVLSANFPRALPQSLEMCLDLQKQGKQVHRIARGTEPDATAVHITTTDEPSLTLS